MSILITIMIIVMMMGIRSCCMSGTVIMIMVMAVMAVMAIMAVMGAVVL